MGNRMDIQSTLSTLAEVAITLAGFTGLLIALTSANKEPKQAFFRVAAMLSGCLFIIVAALLPAPLLELGLSEQTAWGIPTIIEGVGQILVPGSIYIALKRGLFVSKAPAVSISLLVPTGIFGMFLIAAPVFELVESYAPLLVFACLWSVITVGIMFILSILWALDVQVDEPEAS